MPTELDTLTRAQAATDPSERQAIFYDLCRVVETSPNLVERVAEATAGWPASERRAPPYTINKLVAGRLPYSSLSFIGGLRLFDLVLDEATNEPANDARSRFASLGRWADNMPADLNSSVEHIDWSYAACDEGIEGFYALRYGAKSQLDFRGLAHSIALAVLNSPLCRRLRTLNLSKGPWLAESLNDHDDYLAAERVMYCFMDELSWDDVASLPCARSLEKLALHGTGIAVRRGGPLDIDDDEYIYPPGAAPFPELRYLDAGGCHLDTGARLVSRLVARGAMPKLETLDLTDNISAQIAELTELHADDPSAVASLHHDYTVKRFDAFYLSDLATQPFALRRIIFGGAAHAIRADLEAEERVLHPQIEIAVTDSDDHDVVVPWHPPRRTA